MHYFKKFTKTSFKLYAEHDTPIAIEETREDEVWVEQLTTVSANGAISVQGATAETLKDFKQMYYRHAHENGFSVRKTTLRGPKECKNERYLVCSCEGHRPNKPAKKFTPTSPSPESNEKRRTKRKNPIKRCGCKAGLRIKLDPTTGLFTVVKHTMVHNHEFTRPEWQHLHRSQRQIT